MTDGAASSRLFGKHLGAIARATRVYDVDNRAVSRLVGWCARDLTALVEAGPEARFEIDGGVLVVNGTPLRLRRDVRAQIALLGSQLRERGTGGFRITAPVPDAALQAVFRALSELPTGATREQLQARLDAAGAAMLQAIPPRTLQAGLIGGSGELVRAAASDALQAYVRAVLAVKHARAAGALERVPAAVHRAVQMLAEVAEEDARNQLALAALKRDTAYEDRHPVHATILALALGRALGLERAALMELGFATLIVADRALWGGGAAPAASGAELAADVATMIQSTRLTAGRVRRLLVAYEARAGLGRDVGAGLRLSGRPHLFSRIAAVACDYDALTTSGHGRRGLLPDEALAEMQRAAGKRYDAAILEVFSALLGRWPLGATVRLDSGEIAVVFHTPSDPAMAARPIVRVVTDVFGRSLSPGPLVDLAAEDEQRRILGTADPAAHGIDADRALFG